MTGEAEGVAEIVQDPRLALAVTGLASALQGDAAGGDAVCPVAAATEHLEQGSRQPPGDLMKAGPGGLAGGGDQVGTLIVVPGEGLFGGGEAECRGIIAGRGVQRDVVAVRGYGGGGGVGGAHVAGEQAGAPGV